MAGDAQREPHGTGGCCPSCGLKSSIQLYLTALPQLQARLINFGLLSIFHLEESRWHFRSEPAPFLIGENAVYRRFPRPNLLHPRPRRQTLGTVRAWLPGAGWSLEILRVWGAFLPRVGVPRAPAQPQLLLEHPPALIPPHSSPGWIHLL